MARSTNMFALGLLYWLYERDISTTVDFINKKFKKRPLIVEGNVTSLKTGYYYGETIEAIKTTYRIDKAEYSPGKYRNIMGNQAIALGLLTASHHNGIELFYGGYPITPASDILHYLSNYKSFGVKTFQAEDEIAGIETRVNKSNAEIQKLVDEVNEKKNIVKDALISIKKSEEQQKGVRNNREYDAISKEIEFQSLEIELSNKRAIAAESVIANKKEVLTISTSFIHFINNLMFY